MGFTIPGTHFQYETLRVGQLVSRPSRGGSFEATNSHVFHVHKGAFYYFNREWGGLEPPVDRPDSEQETDSDTPLGIQDLPPEILCRIVAYSRNIEGVREASEFLRAFINAHEQHILRTLVDLFYVHTMNYKLKLDVEEVEGMSMTLEEMEHRAKKRRFSGEYQYRDRVVVMDSAAFAQPYMSHRVFRRFHVDCMLPKQAISAFAKEIAKEGSEKAKVIGKFQADIPVVFPYLDQKNPENLEYGLPGNYEDKVGIIRDVVHLGTLFSSNLSKIIRFIIQLNFQTRQEEGKHIKLKELKKIVSRQSEQQQFHIEDDALVLAILSKTSHKWNKFLLPFVAADKFSDNVAFWTRIFEEQRIDWSNVLSKYGIEAGPRVINEISKKLQ